MKRIQVASGQWFKVDDDVYAWASKEKWHLSNGYPTRSVPKRPRRPYTGR